MTVCAGQNIHYKTTNGKSVDINQLAYWPTWVTSQKYKYVLYCTYIYWICRTTEKEGNT